MVMIFWQPAWERYEQSRVGTGLLVNSITEKEAMFMIRPWQKNPCYWEFKGQPTLLLGGSSEDNLFQYPDVDAELELLASVGGNYVRNTMSDRDAGNVYAYAEVSPGLYDLNRWNEEYWRRFEHFLQKTAQLNVIVQIEIWDRFDLTDAKGEPLWQRHPYNPANNVNYSYEETGFARAYPDHPGRDLHPFFHTLPGLPLYHAGLDRVRVWQERYVRKVLSYTLAYDHILYCMNNETSTPPRWGQYWIDFIRREAEAKGKTVFLTDMFDDFWKAEESEHLQLVMNDPVHYMFVDASQVNSRNFGRTHWEKICWIRSRIGDPRPVNHVKIYSAGETGWGSGTPLDGIERFWHNILSGCASCRFHRPGCGIGLNAIAQANIRSARLVEQEMSFFDLRSEAVRVLDDDDEHPSIFWQQPDTGKGLLFVPRGERRLEVPTTASCDYHARWLNLENATWGEGAKIPANVHGAKEIEVKGPGLIILSPC